MARGWTFGRRIAAGFAAIVALTVVAGLITVVALSKVVSSKDRVINVDSRLVYDAGRLDATSNEEASLSRGFLLTEEESFLDQMTAARREFNATLQTVKQAVHTAEGRRLTQAIELSEAKHQQALDGVISLRRTGATLEAVSSAFEARAAPKHAELKSDIDAFIANEERLAEEGMQASSDTASAAVALVGVIVIVSGLIAAMLAFLLARSLRRLIGTTVGNVQSSSAELQATAHQQATGAKEQATAMTEITTTITELLATSRQIAESAQRVAQVAEQTAGAGRAGESTIATAQESMTEIRRQVDLIVDHMLELGEKSERIGAVLDIVSELAEQTNILAINSTIEAAGAGEAGKRFAVVADEIRKLADRVADSTKEIRGLIDVVRGAVNTTVMATEIGSKAVDDGKNQFADVASSFEEIAGLVTTTTEAAREIELSTKQQSTAVEQVTVAATSVAQATRETEAGLSQTFQTSTQLTELSKELQRLVEPRGSA
jgi:CHASE3 domain sensor protein